MNGTDRPFFGERANYSALKYIKKIYKIFLIKTKLNHLQT